MAHLEQMISKTFQYKNNCFTINLLGWFNGYIYYLILFTNNIALHGLFIYSDNVQG